MKEFLCDRCGYEGSNCPFPQENHCELFKEKEDIMNKNFELNGVIYSSNEAGSYFYKTIRGQKMRISKKEYGTAEADYHLPNWNEVSEWEAEANAEKEARENKQAKDAKAAERAVAKRVKKRSKKNVAFTFTEMDGTETTLTEKQVDFIKHVPDTCFYENGLDSTIWIDVLADEIGGQFANKPMTVGAMVSTLREKGIISVGEDRVNGKRCKFFEFTELGKILAGELGLK